MFKELNGFLPIDFRNPINKKHPLARGMIAWWICLPGLIGGQTWYDLHDNNFPAILTSMGNGNNGWKSSTRLFGSMLFDGTAGFCSVQNLNNIDLSVSEMTVVANVNTNLVNSVSHPIFSNFTGTTVFTFELVLRAANNFVIGWGGTQFLPFSFTPSVNTWYHVAGVRQGVTGAWFPGLAFNGILTMQSASTSVNPNGPTGTYTIGKRGTNAALWSGNIADIIVYNRALSAIEIQSLYTESLNNYPNLLNRVSILNRGILSEYFYVMVNMSPQVPFGINIKGP